MTPISPVLPTDRERQFHAIVNGVTHYYANSYGTIYYTIVLCMAQLTITQPIYGARYLLQHLSMAPSV